MDPFVAKERPEEEEGEEVDEVEEGMTRGLTFDEVLHLLTRKAVMGPVSDLLHQFQIFFFDSLLNRT